MKVYDYKQGADNDLVISGGDFEKTESTLQHQNNLLIASPGNYKNEPLMGVDIGSFLLDDRDGDDLKMAIEDNLSRDGMVIREMRVSGNMKLTLEAEYQDEAYSYGE